MLRRTSLKGAVDRLGAAGSNGSAGRGRLDTVRRKSDHIRINLEEDVAAKGLSTGFNRYRFVHCALPQADLDQIDLSTRVLDRGLDAPLLISCMTGGTLEAKRINTILAQVADELGLAIGLGSGRVLLEHRDLLHTFDVRPYAPRALLFANLGAVQLNKGVGVDDCRRLIDALHADALVLHLNPLQEALQPEGDTCFGGLLGKIAELCARLDRPVIAKEVGWGLAPDVVRSLLDAGVAGVDVAGAGGTSWSEVERHRTVEPWRAHVAAAFAGWGLPTAEALRQARSAAPEALVFASGGIHDGLEAAKAIALGADLVGLAGPFLRAAARDLESAVELGRALVETLRVAMFCIGARTVGDLRQTARLVEDGAGAGVGAGAGAAEGVDAGVGGGARVHAETLTYQTPGPAGFIDITQDVAEVVARSGVREGQVTAYSNHTTAAIRINENEPLLMSDFRQLLQRLAPPGGYEHDDMSRRTSVAPGEPMNGHAHCQHLLLSSSEVLPVTGGRLTLGPWQSVFLVELCSPRSRRVTVQVMGC